MPPKRKNKSNGKKRANDGARSSNTQVTGDATRMPVPTSKADRKPAYNPTWNPQWLKVARTFQYTAPAGDIALGFGRFQDLAVGSTATLLSYNSAAYWFRLIDVPRAFEFGAIFDQYRIAGVKMDFDYISGSESVISTTTTTSLQCTLLMYEDFDDSTAPTADNDGWQEVYESGRAIKRVFPNRTNSISYMLKPKFLIAANDEAGTTDARALSSAWTDGATTNETAWRGLKVIVQANPTTTTYVHTFRATATYYVEYRNRH